jgi:xylulose-5-phosphate/fructose-6-phosphate phosphoketolase
MIYISGPGHGAPATIPNANPEGAHPEIRLDESKDEEGMHKFFKGLPFPGDIGSHCTSEALGSVHKWGGLGYFQKQGIGTGKPGGKNMTTIP